MARPSRARWHGVNNDRAVKAALVKRAEKVAARARAISRAEGGTANYSIRTGNREGGRAFADVVSGNRDEEFGTEDTKRIGALRRAARGG